KLRHEIHNLGVQDIDLKGIDDRANLMMRDTIRETVQELLDKKQIDDAGRTHELTNALTAALTAIAKRIDRGFGFEVRVNPTEEPPADAAPELAGDLAETASACLFRGSR